MKISTQLWIAASAILNAFTLFCVAVFTYATWDEPGEGDLRVVKQFGKYRLEVYHAYPRWVEDGEFITEADADAVIRMRREREKSGEEEVVTVSPSEP